MGQNVTGVYRPGTEMSSGRNVHAGGKTSRGETMGGLNVQLPN